MILKMIILQIIDDSENDFDVQIIDSSEDENIQIIDDSEDDIIASHFLESYQEEEVTKYKLSVQ